VGGYYDVTSYRQSIERACVKAGVPKWTPHRLRHSAATAIRKEFGLEGAQTLLGHASLSATQLYAEIHEGQALEIALKIG